MSLRKLNNSELQACRKLLMLDVREAAEFIGNVSNRTWQYWESGLRRVPDDVYEAMYEAITRRNRMVDDYDHFFWQCYKDGKPAIMNYYHTFDNYEKKYKNATKLDWRLHQSALAFLFSQRSHVELIC